MEVVHPRCLCSHPSPPREVPGCEVHVAGAELAACVTSPTELTGGSACSGHFRVCRRENFDEKWS